MERGQIEFSFYLRLIRKLLSANFLRLFRRLAITVVVCYDSERLAGSDLYIEFQGGMG